MSTLTDRVVEELQHRVQELTAERDRAREERDESRAVACTWHLLGKDPDSPLWKSDAVRLRRWPPARQPKPLKPLKADGPAKPGMPESNTPSGAPYGKGSRDGD